MTGFHEHTAKGTEGCPPGRAVAAATAVLAGAGIGPARAEAEQLAAHVLGVSRGRLALARRLSAGQLAGFEELVDRRARREPLQHLIGSAGFRYLELAVGPGVFVPRPETELLAGWGIAAAWAADAAQAVDVVDAAQAVDVVDTARAGRLKVGTLVVDLCSGSGAIALAVAEEVPTARVIAVERAEPALAWLRRNAAERVAAGDRPIEVVAGDVTDPALLAEIAGRVDVLLCNPPYVPAATVVPPEVADHDPPDAVFGGPDGLAVVRPVIDRAAELLRPGGLVGIEHDESQAAALPVLLRAGGRFEEIASHPDLTGRPRFVTARRWGGTGTRDGGPAWQTGSS